MAKPAFEHTIGKKVNVSVLKAGHATSKVLESQKVISVRTCVVSHHPSPWLIPVIFPIFIAIFATR
jgi:hypothetical protein